MTSFPQTNFLDSSNPVNMINMNGCRVKTRLRSCDRMTNVYFKHEQNYPNTINFSEIDVSKYEDLIAGY